MLKRIAIALGALLLLLLFALHLVGIGTFGRHEGPGVVTESARPAEAVSRAVEHVRAAANEIGVAQPKQILFGDLHVHTTFSLDAFITSLPVSQGGGSHPPADACDFARYCSALDFWSINDHAEGITPLNWRETVDSIRQCNAVAGDPENPDTVAFLGWEWTDVGTTPDAHYGHKNVVLAHTDEARIPARPIAATSTAARMGAASQISSLAGGALALAAGEARYHDLVRFLRERKSLDRCPDGVDVHAGGPLPQTRRVGARVDRDPPRHHLGFLYAARFYMGPPTLRRAARSRTADAARNLFGPRQLGALPRLARCALQPYG